MPRIATTTASLAVALALSLAAPISAADEPAAAPPVAVPADAAAPPVDPAVAPDAPSGSESAQPVRPEFPPPRASYMIVLKRPFVEGQRHVVRARATHKQMTNMIVNGKELTTQTAPPQQITLEANRRRGRSSERVCSFALRRKAALCASWTRYSTLSGRSCTTCQRPV